MAKSSRPRPKGASPGRWKEEPDEHDYPAAADYLELLLSAGEVVALVEGLRAAPLTTKKAKDSLRASRLPLLPGSDVHVREELGKIARNSKLSPVLLVRGSSPRRRATDRCRRLPPDSAPLTISTRTPTSPVESPISRPREGRRTHSRPAGSTSLPSLRRPSTEESGKGRAPFGGAIVTGLWLMTTPTPVAEPACFIPRPTWRRTPSESL